MGYWDNASPEGSSNFISKEEKEELLASRDIINVKAISEGTVTFEGHPAAKYFLRFDLDGEERTISFGKGGDHPVESRDNRLAEMKEYLENEAEEGETIPVILARKGRSWLVKPVDYEE